MQQVLIRCHLCRDMNARRVGEEPSGRCCRVPVAQISRLDSVPFIALVYSSLSFQQVPGLLFKYYNICLAKPGRRCSFRSVLC